MQVIVGGFIKLFIAAYTIMAVYYGIFALLLLSIFNIVFFVFLAVKRLGVVKYKRLFFFVELFYGFFNPSFYIAVMPFEISNLSIAQTQGLVVLLLLTLLFYWISRLILHFCGNVKFGVKVQVAATIFALITLSLFFAIAIVLYAKGYDWRELIFLPYYLIPYVILFFRLRTLKGQLKECVESSSKQKKIGRLIFFMASLIVLAVFSPVMFSKPHLTEEIEKCIISEKDEISSASKKYGVDPKILAAIMYYNMTTHKPTDYILESLSIEFNNSDPRAYMAVSDIFDFSVGPCQIKPKTAITALYIYFANKRRTDWSVYEPKDYRSAYVLDDSWRMEGIIPYNPENKVNYIFPSKEKVLGQIKENPYSIQMAAYILHLYQLHWKNNGYPIEGKTDILISLYFLGFQKSFPKADPKPIDKIENIMKVYNNDFIQNLNFNE